jgi:Flp pilus assembly CpaE family ATPase
LTAIADPRHEADLAARLHDAGGSVTVVRRCVDLPELLAAAAAGVGRAAILSPQLRLLDRAAIDRLAQDHVAAVGFAAGSDALGQLERLGVARVVTDRASVDELCSVVEAAVDDLDRDTALDRILDWSGDRLPSIVAPPAADQPVSGIGAGKLIAIWGPTGAPGRTSVGVNLAGELAGFGRDVLLIDADCYGGTIAQTLGLFDEAAGIATACRAANSGRLDEDSLRQLLAPVRPHLHVLTGINRADRWTELRPGAVAAVLECARLVADFVLVDTGFCLEDDEELSYDTAAPRRNGSTFVSIAAADTVLAVAAGDPLGLTRYVRARSELSAVCELEQVVTVVNRVRAPVLGGGDPIRQIATALARHAGVSGLHAVPQDIAAYDAALAIGRTLGEVAPRSPARRAIQSLAAELAELPVRKRRRR